MTATIYQWAVGTHHRSHWLRADGI